MLSFKIHSSQLLAPGANWREQLIDLLGSKPRRLSHWCELGLFGALSCVQRAGASQLPSQVAVKIYTEYGTLAPVQAALQQANDYLPMPFAFMQTQQGQLLNALGSALNWHGEGYNLSYQDRRAGELALLQAIAQPTLLAWVDEQPEPISRWLWLEQAAAVNIGNWQPTTSIFQISPRARWLQITSEHRILQAEA